VDLVAVDVLSSQARNGPQRTYVNLAIRNAAAKTGSIFNVVGKYYLSLDSGIRISPDKMRMAWTGAEPWTIHRTPNELVILNDLSHAPGVRRAVVWDSLEDPTSTKAGSIVDSAKWMLLYQDTFTAYDHWTWQRVQSLRRRVFIPAERMKEPEHDARVKESRQLDRQQREQIQKPSAGVELPTQHKPTPVRRPTSRPARPTGR
jgi:hypothetical protein